MYQLRKVRNTIFTATTSPLGRHYFSITQVKKSSQ
jgi:hypothetical protein